VIVKPIIALISVTVISLIVLNMIFQNEYKSAVVFSISIFLVFLFGPLYFYLCSEEAGTKILRFRYFVVLYFSSFTAILFFSLKLNPNFKKVSNFINSAGLVILFLIFFNIVSLFYSTRSDLLKFEVEQKNISGFKNYYHSSSIDGYLPDIYYIVLDSYPSQEHMRDILSFENDDFINYLRNSGFFITTNSRSNYNFTRFSMSATLNLDYLSMEKMNNDIYGLKKNDIYFKRIEDSQAISYLKLLGYNRYIDSPLAGKEYQGIGFCNSLLIMTPLISPYIQNFISTLLFRGRVLSTLRSLENPINVEKPVFIYAHVMIPHVPYMFDRHGNMPSIFSKKDVHELFIEQLLYANARIKKIIDNILSNYKENKPIIIIQGDHGPDIMIKDKEKRMKMRTSILNAVYLPDGKENIFYDGMTSVNTFRIIFNKYFGADLELLPDVTYYQEDERGGLVVYNPN
jgi:hypothetical protein